MRLRRLLLAAIVLLPLTACGVIRNGNGFISTQRSCGGTFTIYEPGKPPQIIRNDC